MKLLHTADLHIGKKLFELSLIEDQRFILKQIVEIARKEQVDAVLIAGDVYDRSVPSTEAVSLLDDFLTELIRDKIAVIMISGNHDSPERVAFADRILERQGLHIAGNYELPLKTVVLEDEYGPVHFVCMPYVKPAAAGAAGQGNGLAAQAVEQMLSRTPMTLSLNQRYVLLAHYFVAGEQGELPKLSDSETDSSVGGLDSVPVQMFSNFAYVALGHLHRPQRIGQGQVYYSGSPLKYSFSEARGSKSVNIVELGEPGQISVKKAVLTPLHEMRCIKGKLAELMRPDVLSESGREDYIQAVLTDTEELIDPVSTLRSVYPNVLQILMEKNMQGEDAAYESRLQQITFKRIDELFGEFYEMLKGEPMDEVRRRIVEEVAGSL